MGIVCIFVVGVGRPKKMFKLLNRKVRKEWGYRSLTSTCTFLDTFCFLHLHICFYFMFKINKFMYSLKS